MTRTKARMMKIGDATFIQGTPEWKALMIFYDTGFDHGMRFGCKIGKDCGYSEGRYDEMKNDTFERRK